MKNYNDEIQLKDILIKLLEYKAYVLSKKLIIIGLSGLFFVLGIIFSLSNDKKYIAELTFVVDGQSGGSSLGAMSGIASNFGFDIGSSSSTTFSEKNILEFLKSRGVVEAALMQNRKINKIDDLLIEHYLYINEIKDSWENDEFLDPVSFQGILTKKNDVY